MRLRFFTLHFSFFAAFLLLFVVCAGCKENIKEPAVAGTFYPADEKTLKDMVNGFLSKAEGPQASGELLAIISPHAGYQFSGQVAAYGYRHLIGKEINTVILIGPSHHVAFKGVSVYTKGKMRTPLGAVKINENVAKSLINEKADVSFYPQAFDKEHSLEVQLPFLQQTLKSFTIVPILIGSPTRESYEFLTKKITEVLKKEKGAIIIVSTDLSHFYDYAKAVVMDTKAIDAIERMSLEDINKYIVNRESEMCGEYPFIFALTAAKNSGATNGIVYKYANSGDVTGDKDRVVGYASMGIYKSRLTKAEEAELLALAKNTIISYVTQGKIPDADTKNSRLRANGATFVTINRNGNLRGCIGNLQPLLPLYKSVIMNAVSAATKDPRFPAMSRKELKDMEIEISILSPFEPLNDIKQIEIGRHGLLLVKGPDSGIFLPQVPVEFGWDLNIYLENLSLKAGLPKDSWKEAELYTFTADVIK